MIVTYGDTLAGWLNGTALDGTGLWALLLLLLAVLVLTAVTVLLIRAVKTAMDAA